MYNISRARGYFCFRIYISSGKCLNFCIILEQVALPSLTERQAIHCPPAGNLIRHNLQIQTNKTPAKASLLLKLTNYSPRTDIKPQWGLFHCRGWQINSPCRGGLMPGRKTQILQSRTLTPQVSTWLPHVIMACFWLHPVKEGRRFILRNSNDYDDGVDDGDDEGCPCRRHIRRRVTWQDMTSLNQKSTQLISYPST